MRGPKDCKRLKKWDNSIVPMDDDDDGSGGGGGDKCNKAVNEVYIKDHGLSY